MRLLALVFLTGCTAEAQSLPQRLEQQQPMVARAIDSTHRVVCYVFPNGNGDCEKF